ncbi:hypothetical protein Zmor_024919 [Zophobas morio]|uniref:Uncharacterized protein n=1 Tax=Zophobas morio TaxID=2755281 RepID=A0AA38HQF6_9CUCU|nr:hypothetical protein Zmor_024919 [Zophobas morio]
MRALSRLDHIQLVNYRELFRAAALKLADAEENMTIIKGGGARIEAEGVETERSKLGICCDILPEKLARAVRKPDRRRLQERLKTHGFPNAAAGFVAFA